MIQAACDCLTTMVNDGCTCCLMMNNTPVCCGYSESYSAGHMKAPAGAKR
jgi:hypothetical protein